MQMVNMAEATTQLSRLIDAIEQGAETEIVIARNGIPAARLVSIDKTVTQKQLGIAKGKFTLGDTEKDNQEVALLFTRSKD